MQRFCTVALLVILLLVNVGCQDEKALQTSIEDTQAYIPYTTYRSLDEFLQGIFEAQKELGLYGDRSKDLSPQAKQVGENRLGEMDSIYIPAGLHQKYGIESVDMSAYNVDFVFPETDIANYVSFSWLLSIDPKKFPIEDWFPNGNPLEHWTFIHGGLKYYVEANARLSAPETKGLSVYFVQHGYVFQAGLPYGLSNKEIALLLEVAEVETLK